MCVRVRMCVHVCVCVYRGVIYLRGDIHSFSVSSSVIFRESAMCVAITGPDFGHLLPRPSTLHPQIPRVTSSPISASGFCLRPTSSGSCRPCQCHLCCPVALTVRAALEGCLCAVGSFPSGPPIFGSSTASLLACWGHGAGSSRCGWR